MKTHCSVIGCFAHQRADSTFAGTPELPLSHDISLFLQASYGVRRMRKDLFSHLTVISSLLSASLTVGTQEAEPQGPLGAVKALAL